MQKRIFMQPKLILIPSWGKLLGYPVLGEYKNRRVTNISNDPVIFLSNFECTIIEEDEIKHYLFGVGFYYTKFQIGDANYIIDYRRLTCLVLSDFVYQFILDSSNISAINDPGIFLKEMVFCINFPIDQGDKTENQLSFIHGVLNREIFIPYKEIFMKFVDHLQNVPTFQFQQSKHGILSATHSDFSIIYLSESIPESVRLEFLHSTAGIAFIAANADYVLSKQFIESEIQTINQAIISLESVFREISFNPAFPIDFLENGFKRWKYLLDSKHKELLKSYKNLEGVLDFDQITPNILVTAPIYSRHIPWDETHPRKTLESWGIKPKTSEIRPMALTEKSLGDDSQDVEINLSNYKRGPTQHVSNFELDILKKPTVESKPLPPMPEIKSIKEALKHLNEIVEQDFEAQAIGDRFEEGRDAIRKISFNSKHIWELSKMANLFHKDSAGVGLSAKEKERTQLKLKEWIDEIEEAERLERERLERERLERERLERERLERERLERERLERERMERERLEQERIERERLELELFERERLERKKLEQERERHMKMLQRQKLQAEQSRLKQEQIASLEHHKKYLQQTLSEKIEEEEGRLAHELKKLQLQLEIENQNVQKLTSKMPQNKQEKRATKRALKEAKKKIKTLTKDMKKVGKKLEKFRKKHHIK